MAIAKKEVAAARGGRRSTSSDKDNRRRRGDTTSRSKGVARRKAGDFFKVGASTSKVSKLADLSRIVTTMPTLLLPSPPLLLLRQLRPGSPTIRRPSRCPSP